MPFSALCDPKCVHISSPAQRHHLIFPSPSHWRNTLAIHPYGNTKTLPGERSQAAFPRGEWRTCQWRTCQWRTCARPTRRFYLRRKNLEQCLVHLGANGCWLRQDKGTLVLTNIITLQMYHRGYKRDYFHLLPSLKDAISVDSKISFVLFVAKWITMKLQLVSLRRIPPEPRESFRNICKAFTVSGAK